MDVGRRMPVVLWVSKHEILPAEGEELRRILGDFILLEYRNSIEIREEFLDIVREVRSDIVVVRAPIPVIASLLELSEEYGFEVWDEEMESVGYGSHPRYDEECEILVPLEDGQYEVMRFRHFSSKGRVVRENQHHHVCFKVSEHLLAKSLQKSERFQGRKLFLLLISFPSSAITFLLSSSLYFVVPNTPL
jgi:hypothetical protein